MPISPIQPSTNNTTVSSAPISSIAPATGVIQPPGIENGSAPYTPISGPPPTEDGSAPYSPVSAPPPDENGTPPSSPVTAPLAQTENGSTPYTPIAAPQTGTQDSIELKGSNRLTQLILGSGESQQSETNQTTLNALVARDKSHSGKQERASRPGASSAPGDGASTAESLDIHLTPTDQGVDLTA